MAKQTSTPVGFLNSKQREEIEERRKIEQREEVSQPEINGANLNILSVAQLMRIKQMERER